MISAIGIDPGKYGVAFLLFENHSFQYFSWQGEQKALDQLIDWKAAHQPNITVLEKIGFIPGGAYASAVLQRNYGIWLGLTMGLMFNLYSPTPKQWQGVLKPARKGWTTTKHRAVFTARELITTLEDHVYLKKHHNIADAALLAYVGLERIRMEG